MLFINHHQIRSTRCVSIAILGCVIGLGSVRPDAVAQPYRIERFGIREGLSSNKVTCVLQDRKGFLWVGTQDGLNKYDGYSFRHYNVRPYDSASLPNNVVKCLCQDSTGTIWIGTTGGGLATIDPKSERFITFRHDPNDPQSIASDFVSQLMIDALGRLWIGFANGAMDYFDPRSRTFQHYNFGKLLIALLAAPNGDVFIEFGDHTMRLDWARGTATLVQVRGSDGRLRECYPLRCQNDDWFAMVLHRKSRNSSVTRFDPGSNEVLGGEIASVSRRPWLGRGISVGRCLWFVGYPQLVSLDLTNGKETRVLVEELGHQSLYGDVVNGYCVSGSSVIWLATDNGLVRMFTAPPLFTSWPVVANSLSSRSIRTITSSLDGSLYAITDGISRVLRSTDEGTSWKHIALRVTHGEIWAINRVTELTRDRWMVSTTLGGIAFATLRGASIMIDPIENQVHLPSHCHFVDRDGSIWAGYFESFQMSPHAVLQRLSADGRTILSSNTYLAADSTALGNRGIWTIVPNDANTLWCGTRHGLFLFEKNTHRWTRYAHDPANTSSISSNDVWCICICRSGKMWVGTWGGGLNAFDKSTGTFTHYTTDDGLPSNTIRAIFEDIDGDLWLSTSRGICMFRPSSNIVRTFGADDGVISNDFEPNSGLVMPDGRIFFGGEHGITSFDPSEVKRSVAELPHIVGTSLKVSGRQRLGEIENGDRIELDHNENYFSIEFASLDLGRRSPAQYAYKLDGYDGAWIDAGSSKMASYNNVAPGRYVFRVRSGGSRSLSAEFDAVVVIAPPLWRRWWFEGSAAMSVLLLASFALRERHRRNGRIREAIERAKEQERIELGGALHDGPLQDLYATRFLLEPAAGGSAGLHEESRPSELGELLKKVRADLRSLTGALQIPRFELGFAEEVLSFCSGFRNRYPSIYIDTSDVQAEQRPLPANVMENLYRVLRGTFRNIEKHSEATNVIVSFRSTAHQLELRTCDNGKGFSFSGDFRTLVAEQQYGLLLIRTYCDAIGAELSIESRPGFGTIVSVTMGHSKKVRLLRHFLAS